MGEAELLRDIVERIRRHTPRSWILMSPNSLGEVLLTCAFARSLMEKTGYPVSICVRPEHAGFIERLYPKRFVVVIQLQQSVMRRFSEIGMIPCNYFDIDFPINLSPLQYGGGQLGDFHQLLFKRNGTSGLTLPDIWRYMLRLGWDAPMERPCPDFFEGGSELMLELGLEKQAYALFHPSNNTNKPLPQAFWGAMEEMHHACDMDVCVNIFGSMLVAPLRFSRARLLELGVMEALQVAYHSDVFVSGNNGLQLVLSFFCQTADGGPTIHSVTSDKYCLHYDKLNTDWQGAFANYMGRPSTAMGAPEMLAESAPVYEWYIGADLDAASHRQAAEAVCSIDKRSPYYVAPGAGRRNFPASLAYDHDFAIPSS